MNCVGGGQRLRRLGRGNEEEEKTVLVLLMWIASESGIIFVAAQEASNIQIKINGFVVEDLTLVGLLRTRALDLLNEVGA